MTSIRPAGGGFAATLPSFPDAACAGRWDYFFGPDDESAERRRRREAAAIAICRQCPVRVPCLAAALRHPEQHGVAGGVGEDRRKALRHAWLKRQQRGTEAA